MRRHLGTTERFGVSNNCDFRTGNGPTPLPPTRASSFRFLKPKSKSYTIQVKPIIHDTNNAYRNTTYYSSSDEEEDKLNEEVVS